MVADRVLVPVTRIGAVAVVAVSGCRGHLAPPPPACAASGYVEDVHSAFRDLRDQYVYFDQKSVDWTRAERLAIDAARNIGSKRELVGVLEGVLDNLYDAHAILRANTSHSPRLVPSGLDLWAEWRDTSAIVTAVRPGFGAERAGVHPAMQVLSINGVPIRKAADARLGPGVKRPAPPDAQVWSLLSALAGRHDTPRVLGVRDDGTTRDIVIDSVTPYLIDKPETDRQVEAGWIGDGNASPNDRYGYIRLNALGDSSSVPAFDSAVATFRHASGLILDLRNTPGGGNTSVAEPILGRFITGTQGYQRVVPLNGAAYTRTVSGRGPWRYEGPLVVLVGRWTGSMGEGMAIGLDGMHRGVVVGTPMAGLAGAVDDFKLPCTSLGIAFPTARLLHLDGTPREHWVPRVGVELRAGEDVALQRAVEILRRSGD
jgi:C-terminal processing protease CtpA/Prc